MSRYWKAALPFLLAAVIILAAASRPVVLHIGFPCDSYWNVPGENYYTFIDAAIEKFEAEHPNVKVEYTSGIRVEDYTEWLSGQYLLGQEPDVMVILPEDFVIFSDTASLRELDPFMKQDPEADLSGFYPAALQAGADKGKQYALPLECVPQMMFINKTLLQKEHIRIPDNDWTWDEFYSLCEQLTRDTDGDGIVDQFGVYDYGWEEALVANGCSLFSEDGQHCLLNQSAQESAVQFARKIYQLNAGTDLSEKTFDEGRVAFRPMLFSEYRSYEPYPWRIKRSSNFEWDCIAMPSGTSVGGGNYSRLSTLMLGISQRTKHSRLSWELLKTIACTEEMQTMVYTELSGVSALHGDSNGEDGHFPEEWILSTVAARNAGREQFPEEGMSHLRGTDVTLKSVLESDTEGYLGKGAAQPTLGVLTKLIDSAERLTLQVHPDRPTALRLFQSQYGKTECWHILSGHPVNGEEPCIYYGFQPDMTRARWEALFHAQDIPGMLAGMQKYPVHPGDTILIEGGMPHAIGAGCFLVEIQEPTDYTIRVERTTPSGFAVADSMCHQGLGFEKMFECFHYEPHSREEIHDRWFIEPETVLKTAGGSITTLVGYRNTPLFRLDEVNVSDTLTVDCPPRGSGIYVLEGAGTLSANGRSLPLKKTDQLFVPAGTGRFTLYAEAPLRVLHFFGPEQKK